MTNVVTNMIPDGLAAAPGLAFESEPTTGLFKKAGGKIGIAVAGVEVGELSANGLAGGVQAQAVLFTQTSGAGDYTGTISLPAGAVIQDVQVHGLVLWTDTSASMIIGDGDDPDGFFAATDLKATDLLAGEANTIEHPGGKAGAYIVSEQRKLYSASARDVIGVITQVGTGTAGRTLLVVFYTVPVMVAAVKA